MSGVSNSDGFADMLQSVLRQPGVRSIVLVQLGDELWQGGSQSRAKQVWGAAARLLRSGDDPNLPAAIKSRLDRDESQTAGGP